ncbi:MAG: ribonuclease [Clostridia bacterium]|nr:ribonuclease [Clostridia bacterium]
MQEDAGVTAPIEDENSDELILIEESEPEQPQEESQSQEQLPVIDENGAYYSKDDVALYIHTYGHLPNNFITKKQARELGWEGGSVEDYAPGCSIGGDRFGNYEGILPEGKKYTECDIDTLGRSSRGAKRIVFSNDGCIYYTDDHYETFELLYGEE